MPSKWSSPAIWTVPDPGSSKTPLFRICSIYPPCAADPFPRYLVALACLSSFSDVADPLPWASYFVQGTIFYSTKYFGFMLHPPPRHCYSFISGVAYYEGQVSIEMTKTECNNHFASFCFWFLCLFLLHGIYWWMTETPVMKAPYLLPFWTPPRTPDSTVTSWSESFPGPRIPPKNYFFLNLAPYKPQKRSYLLLSLAYPPLASICLPPICSLPNFSSSSSR